MIIFSSSVPPHVSSLSLRGDTVARDGGAGGGVADHGEEEPCPHSAGVIAGLALK